MRVTLTHHNPKTNGTTILIRTLPWTPVTNAGIHGYIRMISGANGGGAAVTASDIYGSDNPASDPWPVQTYVTPNTASGSTTWVMFFQYITS